VRSFKPELCCLFGRPVAENPTSAMMEAAFRAAGLDWRYVQFEVQPEHLADAVKGMRALAFRGGNVTTPHKVAIVPLMDRLGESAALMGAVNCIVRRGAELVGENTDGQGFVTSLREVCDPRGKRVAILGAGGAARAIGVELALAGAARIHIINRDPARGETLAELLRGKPKADVRFERWQGDWRIAGDVDVLVQATSIGLHPDVDARVPLDPASLRKGLVVADVIPNPPETRLLRDARARGATVLDGLGMLVNQGVIGFRHWTGLDADAGAMRRALEDVFRA
jgi:shikimate dehydrogenase